MNCSACSSRIGAYRDGDLAPRDAALVVAHLASCAACRAYEARYAALETSLARLVAIEPRADFTLGVMAKIAAMPAPAKATSRLWLLVAADALVWVAIGALTALGAIRWKSIAGAAGAMAGKLVVTSGTLFDLAQHFHLTTLLALGALVELAFLALITAAAVRYLPRIRAALAGVTS